MFQLINTFARMQLSKQYIFSIVLLGVILCFKVLPHHSIMHLIEDEEHLEVENCIDCKYQLQLNEVPLLQSQIAQIPKSITNNNIEHTISYISPLLIDKFAFNFSNKAPPHTV